VFPRSPWNNGRGCSFHPLIGTITLLAERITEIHNPTRPMNTTSMITRIGVALVLALVGSEARAEDPSPDESGPSTVEPTEAQGKKPNILVIWGDDIGMWNIGAYTHGMMGRTPNIDSLAKEGAILTDHYGQPSCTAGRAAFIMGQLPLRTGMTTVGIPGSKLGIQKEDPTLVEVLKSQGYATGQFGKNHLGDRNEHLPTVHGFDEWYGNLYHLNAQEEPEALEYPGQKDPVMFSTPGQRTWTIRPKTRCSVASANRKSKKTVN
jgi:Sulfatase